MTLQPILSEHEPSEHYNLRHFRTKHLLQDARRTLEVRGVRPGHAAPGFELASVGGGTVRLSDFHGKPVLLHFGSYS